jgi:hypothetical protein
MHVGQVIVIELMNVPELPQDYSTKSQELDKSSYPSSDIEAMQSAQTNEYEHRE